MDLTWRRDKLIMLPVPRIERGPLSLINVSPAPSPGSQVAVGRFRFYSSAAVGGTLGLSVL